MHISNRVKVGESLVRVSAYGPTEAWVYTYRPDDWPRAVKRILFDLRKERLPETAAIGLVQMVANGAEMTSDDEEII